MVPRQKIEDMMGARRQSLAPSTNPELLSEGYYVYLCSGEVRTIAPADSMEVSSNALAIRLQGTTIASFPRSLVFSCSRTLQSGPVLG
jgi:hypothetical protein